MRMTTDSIVDAGIDVQDALTELETRTKRVVDVAERDVDFLTQGHLLNLREALNDAKDALDAYEIEVDKAACREFLGKCQVDPEVLESDTIYYEED